MEGLEWAVVQLARQVLPARPPSQLGEVVAGVAEAAEGQAEEPFRKRSRPASSPERVSADAGAQPVRPHPKTVTLGQRWPVAPASGGVGSTTVAASGVSAPLDAREGRGNSVVTRDGFANRSRGWGRGIGRRFKGACHKCGQVGHRQVDCKGAGPAGDE